MSEEDFLDIPSYSELGHEEEPAKAANPLKAAFTAVTEMHGEPHDWFDKEDFYKNVLENEGEMAKSLHKNLTAYLKATDSADKSLYKGRVTANFWELHKQIMAKLNEPDLPLEKLLFLRYGALLPLLLKPEHRKAVSSIFLDNRVDEAVWYCDEWVKMVALSEVNPLATDEAPTKREGGDAAIIAKLKTQLEKLQGKEEALKQSLLNSYLERETILKSFEQLSSAVLRREPSNLIKEITLPLDEEQLKAMSDVVAVLRNLGNSSRQYKIDYSNYSNTVESIKEAKRQLEIAGTSGAVMDTSVIKQEAGQIQSIARMSVGRQGNHFPILASQFFNSDLRFIATRENVVKTMAWVEEVDVNIFRREFRRQVNRVPPHVILVPCYGTMGVCWEPYERHNKATSRGRIAVPIFTPDVKVAVITALGMLRWETAKEMAAHYWMEEGLTGQYYQYFSDEKLKGDLRAHFVANYVLWITGESEGMQKLEREVRGIFWRNTPFSQERRETLRKRGFVYEELYKKDLNRASSAGY
ncbi:MAG: hypothetical protein FWE37_07635 [Spirochaetaceae bacterium]|nr:hypothetical protein [Spirochaetaceae bacterium]